MAKKFSPIQRPDDDTANRIQHEIAQSIDSVISDVDKTGNLLDEINNAVTDLVAMQNQVQEEINDLKDRITNLEEAQSG